MKLAPAFGLSPQAASVAAGSTCFALGMLVMRTAPSRPAEHVLADFAVVAVGSDELLLNTPVEPDELLLDAPVEEPLLLDTPYEEPAVDDVLLREDALPRPDPASRVVQLFSSQTMPTQGQLRERIDRHLAGEPQRPKVARPVPDASEALYAALDELRRSLR